MSISLANVMLDDEVQIPEVGELTDACSSPGLTSEPLSLERIDAAKHAYTTRFVRDYAERAGQVHLLTGADVRPQVGTVLLARVVAIGQHKALPGSHGRRQRLFLGDEIIVGYGDRYAPDQFEAEIPHQLTYTNLVAAGGVAADVLAQHARMNTATILEPLGVLSADGQTPLTLQEIAPHSIHPRTPRPEGSPHAVVVFGTSMNAGKSTVVAYLVRGLVDAGLRVHAGKATGTGAWNDPGHYSDAGAHRVLDFTDFGWPTTYRMETEPLLDLVASLRDALSEDDPDVVVIEVADGIFQQETARVINDPKFKLGVDSVLFASGEALGAVAGVDLLRDKELPVKAVSGVLTASPLAAREASNAIDAPIVDTFMLGEPQVARTVLGLDDEAR